MKKILLSTLLISSALFAEITWLKEADKRMKWADAMEYCKNMNARLPTKKEYQKIWYENDRASDLDGFNLSVSYWTSSEVKDNIHAAYPFYFVQGRDTWYYKADRYGVRCVK